MHIGFANVAEAKVWYLLYVKNVSNNTKTSRQLQNQLNNRKAVISLEIFKTQTISADVVVFRGNQKPPQMCFGCL